MWLILPTFKTNRTCIFNILHYYKPTSTILKMLTLLLSARDHFSKIFQYRCWLWEQARSHKDSNKHPHRKNHSLTTLLPISIIRTVVVQWTVEDVCRGYWPEWIISSLHAIQEEHQDRSEPRGKVGSVGWLVGQSTTLVQAKKYYWHGCLLYHFFSGS